MNEIKSMDNQNMEDSPCNCYEHMPIIKNGEAQENQMCSVQA
jgi:hypothetical protein